MSIKNRNRLKEMEKEEDNEKQIQEQIELQKHDYSTVQISNLSGSAFPERQRTTFYNSAVYQKEEASFKGLCCVMIFCIILFVFSYWAYQESFTNERDQNINDYIIHEDSWNRIYRPELRSLKISIIKDISLYNKTQNEISDLNKKLVNSQSPNNKIQERLQILKARDSQLKQPIIGTVDNKDAHLLNERDMYGNLPEYRPYQFETNQFSIGQKLTIDEGNKDQGGVVSTIVSQLQSREEFEEVYWPKDFDRNEILSKRYTNAYLELITVRTNKKQILMIPELKSFQIMKKKMLEKKSQRNYHCKSQKGQVEEDKCVRYFKVAEYCISIAKNQQTGEWKLDDNRYNQNSFGCGFGHIDIFDIKKDDTKMNKLYNWEQIKGESHMKNYDYLFPLETQQVKFQIRHGGDPLLAVLNMSKGKLSFGRKSVDQFYGGICGISIAILLFIGAFFQCVSLIIPIYKSKMEKQVVYKQKKKYKKQNQNDDDIQFNSQTQYNTKNSARNRNQMDTNVFYKHEDETLIEVKQ